jgi:molybdopterin molybdotransferase
LQVRSEGWVRQKVFFKVKTCEEVLDLLKTFEPVGEKRVLLAQAFEQVLSQDIVSPVDLPGFARSAMDGYAIMAKDSFGATESLPALLEVVGEVKMGEIPRVKAGPSRAVRIATGGMLPDGADGVVMVEYCHTLDENTIEVSRAISPQENVIAPDDDYRKGSVVLSKGTRLRPQDLGAMAGFGILEVTVYKKPKVAIISTGDEVVPAEQNPGPGQVRDINSYTLGALCEEMGAEPVILGLSGDNFNSLRGLVEKGLGTADTVWLSGGSSVGTRDLTVKVFESFERMEVLVHGISISPGKPTIIARLNSCAVFGLPGHTASAMVVAEVFLKPFLSRISGQREPAHKIEPEIWAKLSRNIESAAGRDDYVRVKLYEREGDLVAEPIFGKSGLISTLVDADGLVRVDRNTEGLYEGERVKVLLFRHS